MRLAAARRLTALVVGRRPRPAGRSGWVRTRATSCSASSSRASARSANSGVPAKTRRRKERSGRLAQLLRELCANALLLELRKVLDEDLALEVIHLVLDANGEQPLRFQGEGIAVLIVRAHLAALRALHQLVDVRHREAAFFDVGHADRL